MGTASIVELARAYGLHPRLWLLLLVNIAVKKEVEFGLALSVLWLIDNE